MTVWAEEYVLLNLNNRQEPFGGGGWGWLRSTCVTREGGSGTRGKTGSVGAGEHYYSVLF